MQATTAVEAVPARGTPSWAERWAPLSGAIFVALFVAALLVAFSALDTGDKLPKATQHFATDDYRTAAVVTMLLALLGAIAFLWFLADLSASARSISRGMLSMLVPVSGVVFITGLIGGLGTWVTPLYAVNHSELGGADPKVAATSYILLTNVGFILFVLAGVAGALLMGAAATTAYRGGFLPRWAVITIVLGAIVAAVGTFIFFIPFLLIVLWVLAASIRRTVLVKRGTLVPVP